MIGDSRFNNQLILYLIVGFWNTVFGLGLYALAYFLFGKYIGYLLLSMLCGEVAILNAFFGYKFIVFKSRSPLAMELFRFHLSCFVALGISTVIMWILVSHEGFHPVKAQAITCAVVIVITYFMHRLFSFSSGSSQKLRAI